MAIVGVDFQHNQKLVDKKISLFDEYQNLFYGTG